MIPSTPLHPLRALTLAVVAVLFATSLTACTVHERTVRIDTAVKGPTPSPSSSSAVPTDNGACTLTEREREVAELMAGDPRQQRQSLICHPTLVEVARERARDMAERGYFDHVTPDGYGPNYLLRKAGYPLPLRYNQNPSANNVESIGAGYVTAEGVWKGLLDSPGHRTHVLGKQPFYASQVEYGIGYAKGGPYGHYWVVITVGPDNGLTAAR
jgi:uncharacterized protein YkwD